MEVAGCYYRLKAVHAFASGTDQAVTIEPEPDNRQDPNAIKVIGWYDDP
jgi:hypothetical protein